MVERKHRLWVTAKFEILVPTTLRNKLRDGDDVTNTEFESHCGDALKAENFKVLDMDDETMRNHEEE
jgi:hypothetical protein